MGIREGCVGIRKMAYPLLSVLSFLIPDLGGDKGYPTNLMKINNLTRLRRSAKILIPRYPSYFFFFLGGGGFGHNARANSER